MVRDRFRAAGLATPELDAKLLAQAAFGRDAMGMLADENAPADAAALAALDALAARRLAGEPVARILGEQEFYGLDFALGPGTLVPRPETEMLVDAAIGFLRGRKGTRLLDLGTGTGCIAIAALANLPDAVGVAVDLNPEALKVATANRARHGLEGRLALREGSWFEPVAGERFDLIVSNPPYIESAAIADLMVEVRGFDPHLALDGGADGLGPYRVMAQEGLRHLTEGGMLALEIGAGQGVAVKNLLVAAGFANVQVENDLAGLDRMVIAHHP